MPGASGQDLTQLLGLQRPDLRVMYMSSFAIIKGRQQFAETENGLELGVPIVLKPFTSQRLMEKVQEVLAAKAPSPFDHAPDPWRSSARPRRARAVPSIPERASTCRDRR